MPDQRIIVETSDTAKRLTQLEADTYDWPKTQDGALIIPDRILYDAEGRRVKVRPFWRWIDPSTCYNDPDEEAVSLHKWGIPAADYVDLSAKTAARVIDAQQCWSVKP